MNTPTTTATTSTSIIAHQLGFLPAVRRFTHEDGTPCVSAALSGLHGSGLNVRFRNNDRLDLRRANLFVVDRATHSRANVALRLERQRARDAEVCAAIAAVNAAAAGGSN